MKWCIANKTNTLKCLVLLKYRNKKLLFLKIGATTGVDDDAQHGGVSKGAPRLMIESEMLEYEMVHRKQNERAKMSFVVKM